jgi:hypothetical protein
VKVVELDAFCADNVIEHLDLLKIDVQGWEPKVLTGGGKMLNQGRVDFIYTEAAFDQSSCDMVSFAEIHELMSRYKFVLSGMYEHFRWGRKAEVFYCNCLYSRQEIARI